MDIAAIKDTPLSLETVLQESSSLISLPEVCLRLRELIANPYHSKQEVADIIIHDPALAARVLRIANSAYYALNQPVTSISHALCIMGERELNNMVLVTSIFNTVKFMDSHMDINCYWRSSIFSAVVARELAEHCRHSEGDLEMFFVSGLLLNIGRLPLYYHEPKLLELVTEEMLSTSRSDFEIEREQFGFDHADVGAAMARSWNFSELICQSISAHHQDISPAAAMDQCIMYLSGSVSDQLDFTFPKQVLLENLKLDENGALQQLRISQKQFCVIVNSSYEKYLTAFEAFCGKQA